MKALAWLSLLLILGAGSEPVWAHSFYSIYCCQGDQDCQPIPMRSVRATPNGYIMTLAPHEHRVLAGEAAPRSYLTAPITPASCPTARTKSVAYTFRLWVAKFLQ